MMNTPVGRAWALSLLWIGIIALESFAGSSEHTASLLRPLLEFFFGRLGANTFDLIHHFTRKAGHFFGYGLLTLFLYRSWWVTLRARAQSRELSWRGMFTGWMWRAAVLALLCTLVVATLDEWHQSFLPGRGSSAKDVLLDEAGGAIILLVLICLSLLRAKRRRGSSNPVAEPITSA